MIRFNNDIADMKDVQDMEIMKGMKDMKEDKFTPPKYHPYLDPPKEAEGKLLR